MKLNKLLICTILAICTVFAIEMKAESISISKMDASKFPKITASFAAFDNLGVTIDGLQAKDFNVVENGKSVNSSVQIKCRPADSIPELLVTMCIDNSFSMDEMPDYPASSKKRFDWVKRGVELFINSIKFVGRTKISLLKFNGMADSLCDWTDSTQKKRLMDSVNNVKLMGATNYNDPFLSKSVGVVKLMDMITYQDIRRVVVFLTDGKPSPTYPTNRDSIIKELFIKRGITVYCITLKTEMDEDLRYISNNTGGKSFVAQTEQDLLDAYKLIASDAQGQTYCELSYTAPFGCDNTEKLRNVDITLLRPQANLLTKREYDSGDLGIQQIDFSEKIASFGNPQIGVPVQKTIVIKPTNGDMSVADYSFVPSGVYFKLISFKLNTKVVTAPFVVKVGDSLEAIVEFTQKDNIEYRQSNLVLNASPCQQLVTVYGGITDVILENPKGTNVFTTCDNIEVRWSGIDSKTPVNIYYSIDEGKTWKVLVKGVYGNKYLWDKNLPGSGTKYRVYLEVESTKGFKFAKSFTSNSNNFAYGKGIATTRDDLYIYGTGFYNGSQFKMEDKTIVNGGDFDVFTFKMNTDGDLIWLKGASGPGKDTSAAICTDKNSNAYIVGTCQKGIKFGGTFSNLENEGINYLFVAKYNQSGLTDPEIFTMGSFALPGNGPTDLAISGTNIRYDEVTNHIFVSAVYSLSSNYNFTRDNVSASLPKSAKSFIMELDSNLKFKGLQVSLPVQVPPFSSDSVYDSKKDNQYKIGSFSNKVKFGGYDLLPVGKSDVFVTKNGTTKPSYDSSSSNWTIEEPTIKYTQSIPIEYGTVTYGNPDSKVFSNLIENIGLLPVDIDTAYFTGPDLTTFSLGAKIQSPIKSKDFAGVEIGFTPNKIGLHKAFLNVKAKCSNIITIEINGIGECDSKASLSENIGTTNVNVKTSKVLKDVFRNPNLGIIKINPVINPPGEFTIDSIQIDGNNQPLNGAFDVKGLKQVDVFIGFVPSGEGNRTATLDYQVQNGCNAAQTTLNGVGVFSNLTANPIDWQQRRIKTVNKDKLKIQNNSGLPVKITAIKESDNVNFKLNVPANFYPATITANGFIEIDVDFHPIAEIDYKSDLEISVENSTNKVYTFLQGTGVNPQLTIDLICDGETKVGKTSNPKLRLTNNSILVSTDISKIQLNNNEFAFASNNSQILNTPITLAKNAPLDIPLSFTPTSAGASVLEIIANADVEVGNDVDEKYTNPIEVKASLICEATSDGNPAPKNFGGLLGCHDSTMIISIKNQNTKDLIIYSNPKPMFIGDDASLFSHNITNDIVIKNDEIKSFAVTFKPQTSKKHNVELNLLNNSDMNLNYKFSATVDNFSFVSKEGSTLKVEPGNTLTFTPEAEVKSKINGDITKLTVVIDYNDNMVSFDITNPNNLTTNLTSFTWSTPKIVSKGKIELSGTGIIPTPFKSDLFSMKYFVYLGDVKSSKIKVSVKEDCSNAVEVADLILSGICAPDLRLIGIGNSNYFLSTPSPNPVSGVATIAYGIGIEANTRIELINSMGELVHEFKNENTPVGQYTSSFDFSKIASGVYQLRISSGPFQESKIINVVK